MQISSKYWSLVSVITNYQGSDCSGCCLIIKDREVLRYTVRNCARLLNVKAMMQSPLVVWPRRVRWSESCTYHTTKKSSDCRLGRAFCACAIKAVCADEPQRMGQTMDCTVTVSRALPFCHFISQSEQSVVSASRRHKKNM